MIRLNGYLKNKIIALAIAAVFFSQSGLYGEQFSNKPALRKPSSFTNRRNEQEESLRYLRAMFRAAKEKPLMQLLEGVYQSCVYGELHDAFSKAKILSSYAIIRRGVKPIASELYHDQEMLVRFDKVCGDLQETPSSLRWLGEGSSFLAFVSMDPGVAVKYAKVEGSLEVLAATFPHGHRWSQDYGVDAKGKGELHYALWEHIRSFELYGDRAALCKIYISDDAYRRLSFYHKDLLKRFIDIGIVQRTHEPIEIIPVYPDFIPPEKRTERTDGKIKVSVLVLQTRITSIKDELAALLSDEDLNGAKRLVDRYLQFVHDCMEDGIFLMDLSMNNVGIQEGDDKKPLKVFDAIHMPLDFSTGRPILGNFPTESDVLKAAEHSSWEVLERVKNEAVGERAKRLAHNLQDYFISQSGHLVHAARHFEPTLVSNTALVQKAYILNHPVFASIRDVLNGDFKNDGIDMPLEVRQHDGKPSCMQAGLKEYEGRPIIIAMNPISRYTWHNKEWGIIKLPETLTIDANKTYWFVDLITGEEYNYSGEKLLTEGLPVGLSPYRVHALLLHRIEDRKNMLLSYKDILEKAHIPWVMFIDFDGTMKDFDSRERHDPELTDLINNILRTRKTKIVLVTSRKLSEPDKIREVEEYFIKGIEPQLLRDLYRCYGFYDDEEGEATERDLNIFSPVEDGKSSKISIIDFLLRKFKIGPSHGWCIADNFGGIERSVVAMARKGMMLVSVKRDEPPIDDVYYYSATGSKGTKEVLKAALELLTIDTTALSRVRSVKAAASQL